MRYSILITIFASMVVVCSAAQDIPPGSYTATCRNIKVKHDKLQAKCQTSQGNWVKTSLNDVDRCIGDITNVEGQLTCNQNGQPPVGTYTQTCRNIRIRYNTLYASCETSNGQWLDTSLDNFSQCSGGIANNEGRLQCGGYGGNGGYDRDRDRDRDHDGDHDRYRGSAPQGSYTQTCRDIRVQGDDLRASCQTSDGRWLNTSLDGYNRCSGDIVNDEGQLECTRAGGRSVPQGTYSQTCRQIYVRGDTLRAQCETRNGRWNWTQLDDWDSCRSISNQDGQLHCDR
jgi:hypothetical protein